MIGGAGVACPHCGFPLASERAVYCPKCGMKMHG
jgi:DNA-directed RNA polymerase subunit RPC12/RpoP